MIATLLTIPTTASLYSRVAIHSAPLNFNDQSPQVANAVAQLVLKDLNCTNVTCLSKLSVDQILSTQAKLYDPTNSAMYAFGLIPGVAITEPVRTVVDGVLVKGKFGQLTRGVLAKTALKPIIFTTVKDEACQTIDSMSVLSPLIPYLLFTCRRENLKVPTIFRQSLDLKTPSQQCSSSPSSETSSTPPAPTRSFPRKSTIPPNSLRTQTPFETLSWR